jgi:hypothetical protein
MLYPSEKTTKEIRRLGAVRSLTEEELSRRLLAVDPDFALAHAGLANSYLAAGDLDRAERSLWKWLELSPCHFQPYLELARLWLQRDPHSALARRLHHLGVWKLAMLDEIPKEVAADFREAADAIGFDSVNPTALGVVALAEDERIQALPHPPEVEQRLRPYVLLNRLEIESEDAVAAATLEGFLEHRAECWPILRGAIVQWVRREKEVRLGTACLAIAIVGEIGPPATIEELLELAERTDSFLYTHWAIHRHTERHPQAALDAFRAAAAAGSTGLRCGLAEHMYMMPAIEGIEDALVGLLDDFRRVRRHEDAPYLLVAVLAALEHHGFESRARALLAHYTPMLSDESQLWVSDAREGADAYEPRLLSEGLGGLDIEDVVIERTLMDDEDEEDEEDDEDDEDEEDEEDEDEEDEEEDVEDLANRDWEPDGDQVMKELAKHAFTCHSPEELNRAKLLFFGHGGPVKADQDHLNDFIEWLIRDFRDAETGRTALEEYLLFRRHLHRSTRAALEARRDARHGIFEVERVESGRGLHLKNVFSGEQIFVRDQTSSREARRGDCLVSRVETRGGRSTFSCNSLLVTAASLPELRQWIETGSREAGRRPHEFMRANSHLLDRKVRELHHLHAPLPKVVNREGDVVEFSRANYQVLDRAALLGHLRDLGFIEETGDDGTVSFTWLEGGPEDAMRSVLGTITVREARLRLECQSRQRLKQGRRMLEKAARGSVKHLGDSFESLEAARARFAGEPATAAPPIPPEVEREAVRQMQESHYNRWPDEKLPALGGKTPRQAVKSRAGRAAVIRLLREMQDDEDQHARPSQHAFDFNRIRRALGLEPE